MFIPFHPGKIGYIQIFHGFHIHMFFFLRWVTPQKQPTSKTVCFGGGCNYLSPPWENDPICAYFATLRKFNIAPEKLPSNRKVVFQPPFFRGYVKLRGCNGLKPPTRKWISIAMFGRFSQDFHRRTETLAQLRSGIILDQVETGADAFRRVVEESCWMLGLCFF